MWWDVELWVKSHGMCNCMFEQVYGLKQCEIPLNSIDFLIPALYFPLKNKEKKTNKKP
jgi:hypothetical protein